MTDIIDRLENCRHGLFWPEARDAIDELTTARARIRGTRGGKQSGNGNHVRPGPR